MKTALSAVAIGALAVGLLVAYTRGADDRPGKHTCNCAECEHLSAEVAALKAEVAKVASGRVAVVDLDKVATEMGWMSAMTRAIDATNQQLTGRISQLRDQLKAQIDAKAKDYGDNPTREQREELARMQVDAERQLQVAAAQASQEANRARLNLVMQYRDDIRPVAKRIAAAEGLSVVVVPTEVLSYNPACDITAKVIDALEEKRAARPPSTPAPPAPATQPGK